jgi:hypothetical protein
LGLGKRYERTKNEGNQAVELFRHSCDRAAGCTTGDPRFDERRTGDVWFAVIVEHRRDLNIFAAAFDEGPK